MKGKNVPSLAILKKAVMGNALDSNWLGGKMPKNNVFVKMYLNNTHIKKKIGEYMQKQANIKNQQDKRRAQQEDANAIMYSGSKVMTGGLNMGPVKRNNSTVNAMRIGGKVESAIITQKDTGNINSSVPLAVSTKEVSRLISNVPNRGKRNNVVAQLRKYLKNFKGNKSPMYKRAQDTINDYTTILSANNKNRKGKLTAILKQNPLNKNRKNIATKLYTNVHLEQMEAKYGNKAKDVIRIDKKLSLIMPLRAESQVLELPGIESDIARTFPNKNSKLLPSYKYLSQRYRGIKSSLNKK
jgi:hypothetical protein